MTQAEVGKIYNLLDKTRPSWRDSWASGWFVNDLAFEFSYFYSNYQGRLNDWSRIFDGNIEKEGSICTNVNRILINDLRKWGIDWN